MNGTAAINICVLFPGALGDFVCFLPALEALRQQGTVHLFAQSAFADLAPPRVKIAALERYEVRRLFAPGAVADRHVREFFGAYDAVHSWTGAAQREFVDQLGAVCAGRERVHPFLPARGNSHQTDYYLACIGAAAEAPRAPHIALQPNAIAWTENYWMRHSLGRKAVLIVAPGSGAQEKNWRADFYRAVAEWWRQRVGTAVVALIGPVERERGGLDLFVDGTIVADGLTLAQVACLLARGDIYLGNDSGITHVAAAVGARTVALFGPSNLHQWAPRGRKVTVLSRSVECSPCAIAAMKSCAHRRCLNEFYPDAVIAELEKLPEIAALTRFGAGITV